MNVEELNPDQLKQFVKDILEIVPDIHTQQKEIKEIHTRISAFEKQNLNPNIEGSIAYRAEKLKAVLDEAENKFNKINQYSAKFFGDGAVDGNSVVQEIEKNIVSLKKEVEDIRTFTSSIQDESDDESLKNKIKKTTADIEAISKDIESIRNFEKTLYNDEQTANGVKESINKEITNLKSRLTNLISLSEAELEKITDGALHSAFAKRAEAYTEEFSDLQNKSSTAIWCLVGSGVLFVVGQILFYFSEKQFSWYLTVMELTIALPLILLFWMRNRNQIIAKKLAEDYHHKATVSASMTGYRKLNQLKHDQQEYLDYFNKIIDQLKVNPSENIDRLLTVKSPYEKVIDSFEKRIEKVLEKRLPISD
jgi:hypothetical protein